MKSTTPNFLAVPGKQIKLSNYSTTYKGELEKDMGTAALETMKARLNTCQQALYAESSCSLLIIFQAMDAAGKDSAIEHVMSGLNPQGCEVTSFKTPGAADYAHDFLWRHAAAMPGRGMVGIHNRSHYENVLVCKVHPEYVLNERIPGYRKTADIDQDFWNRRYQSIRDFEAHLSANGTKILKFFLYVSPEEQKQRFLDRISDPSKNWKFSASDISERARWKAYMKAYEAAISETSTALSPWYIIPADKKWYARLAISQILVETMEGMHLQYPVLSTEAAAELSGFRELLENEK